LNLNEYIKRKENLNGKYFHRRWLNPTASVNISSLAIGLNSRLLKAFVQGVANPDRLYKCPLYIYPRARASKIWSLVAHSSSPRHRQLAQFSNAAAPHVHHRTASVIPAYIAVSAEAYLGALPSRPKPRHGGRRMSARLEAPPSTRIEAPPSYRTSSWSPSAPWRASPSEPVARTAAI
jgi:hypothetical protein